MKTMKKLPFFVLALLFLMGCQAKPATDDTDSDVSIVEWAEECEADEAIVLYSSFDTDASGGDGSLEPNTTYDDFRWILVRDNGGTWEVRTYGYG